MKLIFEKKEIIRLYKDEQIVIKAIAERFKVSESTIKLVIQKNKQHDIKEL